MNKLYDAMMSGKPILYAVNAPNNYIKDYKCGISVEPENTNELIKGINKFLKMEQAELDAMGQNGRRAVLDGYTTEVLAKKFEECF
jgi:glycosyltransferase involved in cell wall biosynthesis